MRRRSLACLLAVLAAAPCVVAAAEPTACTILSVDEIKAALGRKELAPGKVGRGTGESSDCRFSGGGAGDVRVLVDPPKKSAKADFAEAPEIFKVEGQAFERLSGVGDGAYYFDDRLQFIVGDRTAAVWVNRTPRTEPVPVVKKALVTLATKMAERMRR